MSRIKAFNVRLSKELWAFLKKQSAEQEKSMNGIIIKCLEKYKKTREKTLTSSDTVVS